LTQKISEDIDKLTDLSLSVGRQGRQNKGIQRPLTPIEVAQYIKQLKEETGESDSDISKRLRLGKPKLKEGRMEDIHVEKASDSQVKLFLRLLRIDEKSVRLIGWNGDPGKVVFSTAVLLATHPPEVQNTIIQNVLKHKLGKEEVRAILQHMKTYELSIEESIEKVTKKRVETFDLYKLAYNITSSVSKVLSGLGKSTDEIIEKIIPRINKKLDSKIEGITISENLMVIDMDSISYKKFLKLMDTTKTTYNNCIKNLITGE
tara:strand:- start:3811 stop:4593 length:783 start_codon:yes stop_codon:yes gene_type:complete